jgi:hypothetical protein
MSTFAALRSLHSLIGAALDDIERTFHDNDISLDFPSLDEPCDPSSLAETLLSSPAMVQASKLAVASAGQLTAMVQRPFLTICDASMGVSVSFLTVSQTLIKSLAVQFILMYAIFGGCERSGDPQGSWSSGPPCTRNRTQGRM